MSSGPVTQLDNLVIADGYMDEALAFDVSALTTDEVGDLLQAKRYLTKVIDSVNTRQGGE